MTNLERVRVTFQGCKIGETFTRNEILEMVRNRFPNDVFPIKSIIPSDYCYNLTNLGKIDDPVLYDFNIFEHIDKGVYVYLGENYPYNKDIFHRPKGGKPYKIGSWTNGERIISIEKDSNIVGHE